MRFLLLILFPILVFSQKIDLNKIELGKRNEKYRVWVYFIDKEGSEQIPLNSKTVQRRIKNGILNNASWYDTPVSSIYKDEITSMGLIIENESRWLNAISLLCAMCTMNSIAVFTTHT